METVEILQIFDQGEDSRHQFKRPNTLVVEGPSDLIYLKVMSDVLARKGKTVLFEK